MQEAKFVAGRFEPFGVRNMRQQLHQGQSIPTASQNLIGITPAPRDVVRTEAQQKMSAILQRRGGGGTATPEEREQRTRLVDIRRGLAKGPGQDSVPLAQLMQDFDAGKISGRQAKQTMTASASSTAALQFKRLTADEAIGVYQVATPAEKKEWYPLLLAKLRAAQKAGRAFNLPAEVIP